MECHIMATNDAYKKTNTFLSKQTVSNQATGKKMNVIYSLKGINRVKIFQLVNDFFLQIDD